MLQKDSLALHSTSSLTGYYYAVSAFMMWGIFPIYWKLLANVGAFEVLAHRTLWSGVFIAAILYWKDRFTVELLFSHSFKQWLLLVATSIFIAANWGLFVWAVNNDKVIEASMGYFISPLMSIILGRILFAEQIKPLHVLAIVLAFIGVIIQVFNAGVPPWTGILIALSFTSYSALRKLASVDTLSGLFIETIILAPIAILYCLYLFTHDQLGIINESWDIKLWLGLSGVVTVIPLMLYVSSVRLLDLSVVSFLFFLNPSIQFLLGVFLYNELFSQIQLMGFVLIWSGLSLYIYGSLAKHQ